MTDETRSRFLAAIAREIAAERVIEVHLFSAIRQGGMESGVAVIAVEHAPAPKLDDEGDGSEMPDDDAAMHGDDGPYAPPPASVSRYTVYSARYRHTLKGADRGKWETSVTDEADAPLTTITAVVRGVQLRSGDGGEIARLSGDEFRALLPEPMAAA